MAWKSEPRWVYNQEDGSIILLRMTKSMVFSYACIYHFLDQSSEMPSLPWLEGKYNLTCWEELQAFRQAPLPLSFHHHRMLVRSFISISPSILSSHGCWQWNKHYEKHLLSFFMSSKTEPEGAPSPGHMADGWVTQSSVSLTNSVWENLVLHP